MKYGWNYIKFLWAKQYKSRLGRNTMCLAMNRKN